MPPLHLGAVHAASANQLQEDLQVSSSMFPARLCYAYREVQLPCLVLHSFPQKELNTLSLKWAAAQDLDRMFFDLRLWALTKGTRAAIAQAVTIGVIASLAGIERLGLLGWLLSSL